jgi:hypothetical protein
MVNDKYWKEICCVVILVCIVTVFCIIAFINSRDKVIRCAICGKYGEIKVGELWLCPNDYNASGYIIEESLKRGR